MKVYQIFVDRFSTGNKNKDAALSFKTSKKWMGGNLQGIINKLPYIKSLGFDAIWLTPIFSSADYHSYSTLDFYSIEKHFGSKEIFKKFVDSSHSIGIKVILDFVANHVSYKHEFFQSALKDKRSEYRKWFAFSKDNDYLSFLNVKELPKLNTRNQDVINYLISAGLYWINEFGIDGYRLDHAIGPSMKFWEDFVSSCKKADSEFVFLPEIWLSGVDPKYLNTLWFTDDENARNKLLTLLTKNRGKSWDKIENAEAEAFAMKLMSKTFKTPLDFQSNLELRRLDFDFIGKRSEDGFLFADNHDMQRISWIIKEDRSLNEIFRILGKRDNSIVYYGTEIGLSQKKDFSVLSSFQDTECRRFMDWDLKNRDKIENFKKMFNSSE